MNNTCQIHGFKATHLAKDCTNLKRWFSAEQPKGNDKKG
jgi:hypothetical protein